MTNLPPFSGNNPTCPKCGNVGATTRYTNQFGQGWMQYDYPEGPRIEGEHLVRECNRCGFAWPEAVIPAFKVAVKPWEGGWELHIDGAGVTQAEHPDQFATMARDYITQTLGTTGTIHLDFQDHDEAQETE